MKSYNLIFTFFLSILFYSKSNSQSATKILKKETADPVQLFLHPPEDAKPGVLWMWMGSNVNKEGITKDLEALKQEGIGFAMISNLADVTNPWGATIENSPTPEIIGWTEPWWKMMQFAASEARRLDMKLGIFNCPGYETSGGPWISPELSMQQLCWSNKQVSGNSSIEITLDKPKVDLRAYMPFPVYDTATGLFDYPIIPERNTYFKDIAVLAMPADGVVNKDSIIDLTTKMDSGGNIKWKAPNGNWVIYRFGHTTMGALIQPAQPRAMGLECDKMNAEAVSFQIDHMISEMKKHLGNLTGTTVSDVYFDSYEAGNCNWTPKMKEEFQKRQGYDLIPYLALFAGRIVGSRADSLKFMYDFDNTIKDLYRDVYFSIISKKLKEANLHFVSEPYGGPWRAHDVVPLVNRTMVEFWTDKGIFTPYELEPTLTELKKRGEKIIQSEAFTGQPASSMWDEYPAWLKPIGDMAFCSGINRLIIHRFVHQPWGNKYLPGNTMGQWGTHFDRTQTWWKPAAAMVSYWQRCEALLQWGENLKHDSGLLVFNSSDGLNLNFIQREQDSIHIYFIANTSHFKGSAYCSFEVNGLQPELWDPVTGTMSTLQQFNNDGKRTFIALDFEDAQSYFIVFRHKIAKTFAATQNNFTLHKNIMTVSGTWEVQFDSRWGGPDTPVIIDSLTDWSKNTDSRIKYFSGTAKYFKTFHLQSEQLSGKRYFIDLGLVKHIAHIYLNDNDLGIVWTAPWGVDIPAGILKTGENKLVVEVTNVWANRLIGDEQEPDDCEWLPNQYFYNSGIYLKRFPDWFLKNEPRPSKKRYCFTTWNYFNKNSPLVPSGLMGPVKLMVEE